MCTALNVCLVHTYILSILPLLQRRGDRAELPDFLRNTYIVVRRICGTQLFVLGSDGSSVLEQDGRDLGVGVRDEGCEKTNGSACFWIVVRRGWRGHTG